jgi:RNA polymerase sigma-70 factor (ECF subfamily)
MSEANRRVPSPSEPATQPHSADEAALLSAAQRGDHAAFGTLIERHAQLVHGYLRARLTRLADVEDLGQEVFLRVYTAKATPRSDTPLRMRPWLLGIARNVLREHVRASRRRRETAWTELCLDIEDLSGGAADQGDDYDDVLGKLPDCLGALGPSARQAIDLYYHDDLRMQEIAVRFKRSEGAVKLLVHRARQAVKRCLERGAAVAADGGEEA